MNRGSHVMQKSPVQQQMMGGSPNWWNMINNMRPPIISHNHHHHQQQQAAATHHVPSTFLAPPHNNQLLPHFSTSSTVPPSSSLQDMSSTTTTTTASWNDHNQDQLPESWSQLLLGGLVGEEDKSTILSNMHQHVKKLENNWEEQLFLSQQAAAAAANSSNDSVEDVKQKNLLGNSYDMYDQHGGGNNSNVDNYFHQQTDHELATKPPTNWSQMMPVSSPKSCVTTLSSSNNNSMLDFSNKKSDARQHPPPDHSSECNSRATGGAPNKKARVQPSSTQSTFKVRKEKLGDRITALHQLVSPFGKTDTASVLLEAIGYIRFLQSQIEALSLPYLGNGSANMRHQQQSVQDRNNLFPEDPGQLSNDNCLKRKITSEEDYHEEAKKDLRSRGLCLVPISCTLQVGSDNGADYWAPALGGGFR